VHPEPHALWLVSLPGRAARGQAMVMAPFTGSYEVCSDSFGELARWASRAGAGPLSSGAAAVAGRPRLVSTTGRAGRSTGRGSGASMVVGRSLPAFRTAHPGPARHVGSAEARRAVAAGRTRPDPGRQLRRAEASRHGHREPGPVQHRRWGGGCFAPAARHGSGSAGGPRSPTGPPGSPACRSAARLTLVREQPKSPAIARKE
jgi:hypothetical protein